MRNLDAIEIETVSGADLLGFLGAAGAGAYVGAEIGAAAGLGVASIPGSVVGAFFGSTLAGATYLYIQIN